jgi:plasmid stability protein
MPNVLIRNVPDDVHARLRERAARSGRSLQEFLRREVERLSTEPSLEEIFEEARREGTPNLTFADFLRARDVERTPDEGA